VELKAENYSFYLRGSREPPKFFPPRLWVHLSFANGFAPYAHRNMNAFLDLCQDMRMESQAIR